MSLPLLHAGRTNPGLSAQLDLRFALDKSLTAYRGPTPSFSRASTGSYFDGSGVLRYAALNLLTYSEDFTNAVWTKTNATITANAILSPDGKLTADKISEDSALAKHRAYVTPSVTVGTIYTFSVYAKSAERNWLAMNYADTNANMYAYFNLQNGTIGSVDPSLTASITSVGNGWYRCSVKKTLAAAGPNFDVGPTTGDGVFSYTGTTGNGIYVWGAQLEASSTVGTYCPTTSSANSAPRFDHTYNGTSWVSRGLLVEEQRTNAVLQSSFQSGWTGNSATLTANSASCPDGTNSAMLVVPSSGGNFRAAYQSISGVNCISVFAKASGKNHLGIVNAGGTAMAAWFNLSTGEVGTVVANYTATITSVGSGWYRCSLFSSLANYTIAQFCVTDANGSNSVTVNGSDGILLYGAQAESGSFSTSLIPTTTASATRSADVCQITGTDFSGFWNGTEGTLVSDFDVFGLTNSSGNVGMVWQADDNTLNNRLVQIGYEYSTTPINGVGIFVASGGSPQANMYQSPIGTNIIGKSSFAYKANDFALSVQGASVSSDTSGLVPSVTQLNIGKRITDTYLNGHIARLRYFNKRLPNATLQLLSDPDPTLNLQFALNKTLTPVAGPAPSFSRASTGTYFNASGVLTSASINTPRFDHVYSGGQWVSKGLLVEEQRTNICLQSNTFNTTWLTLNGTVTANAATSPDGTNNAWKLNETSANSASHGIYQPLTIGTGNYTWSVYAKAGERSWLQFIAYSSSTNYFTWFNLANGTVGTNAAGTTASIQDVGGGWYRCSVSRSTSAGSSYAQIFAANADNNGSYAGDPTKGIYIYGCQVEAGSFPTSYIPTTSSSVVRSADVCQITGTSFNWMWNQGEGSVVAEYDRIASASVISGGFPFVWESYSDSNNKMSFLVESTGKETFYGAQAGATNWSIDNSVTFPANTAGKVAGAYKVNDIAVSTNGSSVATDGTANIPVTSSIVIGNRGSGSNLYLNGHIAKLIYYPARLTNTKLQQLST